MSLFPAPSFDHYWAMWNEVDPALVRSHLDRAVTELPAIDAQEVGPA